MHKIKEQEENNQKTLTTEPQSLIWQKSTDRWKWNEWY